MHEPLTQQQKKYWDMAGQQCGEDDGGGAPAIRFLKYLLAGFCMLVLNEPGHPAGTPSHGGDSVLPVESIIARYGKKPMMWMQRCALSVLHSRYPKLGISGPQLTRANTGSRSSSNIVTNSITSTDNSKLH